MPRPASLGSAAARAGQRLGPSRRARLLAMVRESGAVAVADLAAALGVSAATVRRDLDSLTSEGALARAHGGALAPALLPTGFEPPPREAARQGRPAKRAIAAAAAALVEPGQTLILDSSTTVLEAARRIVARGVGCTVVTNDLRIAALVAEAPKIRLIVLGGTLRAGSATLTGEPGASFAQGLAVDLAFLGAHAVTGLRVSETSSEVASLKRIFAAAARRAVLLADSSKFAPPAFVRAFDLGHGALVLSDPGVPRAAQAALARGGVELRRIALSEAA